MLRQHNKFLHIVFTLLLLVTETAKASICAERWPVLIDFELIVTSMEVNTDDPRNPTYSMYYVIETTVPPEGGGVVLYGGEPPGTTFRAFSTTDNLETFFVRVTVDGESFGSRKYVWQPSQGIVPGPVADFSYTVVGNTFQAVQESTNTNGGNIRYTWDFDNGSNPSVVQTFNDEDPPPVEFFLGPGNYCVSLFAEEMTDPFGGFTIFDQKDQIVKDIVVEEDAPIANFDVDVLGRLAKFTNTSRHPSAKPMTFTWDFGDGNTASSAAPEHIYEQPGTYTVTLTASDPEGDSDFASASVTTEYALVIEVTANDTLLQQTEELIRVDVYNYERDDIDNLRLPLTLDEAFLVQQGVAEPAVLKYLPLNDSFTTYFRVVPQQAGDTLLVVEGEGELVSGGVASSTVEFPVTVQPDVVVSLTAPSVQAAGEDVTITLFVTNNEAFAVEGLRTDSLVIVPTTLMTPLSGPTDASGNDPRTTPLTIPPGETVSITWTYRTEGSGIVDLNALVSYNQVNGDGRFSQGADARLAIDTAALELTQLRMAGGPPAPGSFTVVRGRIENVGNYDITGIDFRIGDTIPQISHLERPVTRLAPEISPRIPVLAPGEVREFLIPVGIILDVGDASRYTMPISFSGTASVGGEDIEVSVDSILRDNLDRSRYWADLLGEYASLYVNQIVEVIDEVNEFAKESMIGGIAVGTGDALLNVLQQMGEGQISAGEFVIENVSDGGEQLTKEGKQLVNVATEYWSTTPLDQIGRDLTGLGYDGTVGSVDIMANWFFEIEKAYSEGNTRRVAQLIAEPGITFASGVGVEQAGAQVFSNILRNPTTRKVLRKFKKRKQPPDDDAPGAQVQRYIDDLDKEWDEIPEGVPLTGQQALAAGVEGDQLAFMIDTAKRHGVTWFVRPRPATAAKWAREGLNAKPLSIKAKSVNDVDYRWLGFDEADEGLVVFREPENPAERLRAAFDAEEFVLPEDREQVLAIIDRYSAKKAQWETRTELLEELNSVKTHRVTRRPDPANPEADFVEEIQQPGIKFLKNGREKITTVSIDERGRLIFDENGKAVYSDIDLLSLATGDGTNLPESLHRKLMREASYGMDGQHHATANSSDFPNANVGRNTGGQYMFEHTRDGGGGALLIIGPDSTTKGFVESFNLISAGEAADLTARGLSNYELFGKIVKNVTFTGGAQTQ